jgi:phospholipid/cholesterol/gamma-HCH transport system substrate-binding protein
MRRRDEVLVGVLMTAAVAVGIVGTLWLVRGGLSSGYPLYTRHSWGQGLKTGQPVLLAGVTVGIVNDVIFERQGSVVVEMRINDKYQIPATSQATIKPNGIFGDMLIALTPTGITKDDYQAGDTVPAGKASPTMDQLITRLDTIGQQVNDVTQAFDMQLVRGGGIEDFRKTLANSNRFMVQLNSIAAEQSRQMTLTMQSLRRSAAALDSAKLDSIVTNMQTTSANLTALTTDMRTTTTQLNEVLAKLNSGEGTAGKLLTDTLLYSNMKNLVARMDSLTADIKKNPRKYINLEIF